MRRDRPRAPADGSSRRIRQIFALSMPLNSLCDAVTIYWLGFRNRLVEAGEIAAWNESRRELGNTAASIERWLSDRPKRELDEFFRDLVDCVERGNRDRCYDSVRRP